jgi:hypothetical protein
MLFVILYHLKDLYISVYLFPLCYLSYVTLLVFSVKHDKIDGKKQEESITLDRIATYSGDKKKINNRPKI